MFTPIGIQQGTIITEGLNVWFDFGNTQCFNPTQGTGSITAGTLFNNLAPDYPGISGSINGAVNWSTAFGGCMNLTNGSTSTLQYTGAISASFTVQVVVTPGTDALPNNNWVSDAGAWPQIPGANGLKWAQQFSPNYLIPILGYGASYATLSSGTQQPASGWTEYMRFPNVYTFSTNASNAHITYTNNILKGTDTSTRTRSNQTSVATAYLNTDIDIANRKGIGRICAYLSYNRQLSDAEIYQNVQFYLNRFGTK